MLGCLRDKSVSRTPYDRAFLSRCAAHVFAGGDAVEPDPRAGSQGLPTPGDAPAKALLATRPGRRGGLVAHARGEVAAVVVLAV